MKKIINSLLVFAFLATVFSSCGTKDVTTPNPGPDTGDHKVLWSYELGAGGLSDITPAIDENDNIYFSIVQDDGASVVATALDKDGNELWASVVEGSATNKVTYSNGKVFVVTDNPVAIICINASNGNTLWSKNLTNDYDFEWIPQIAVNNNKVYLSSGQLFYGYLMALDFSGNELWIKQGPTMGGSFNLSVSGNALYFHDGETLFRYNDNGASCDSVWSFDFGNIQRGGLLAYSDLPIGDDGNIYVRSSDIYVISPDGQLVRTINLDISFNEMYFSNITLCSNNDFLIGKGDLFKFDNTGNQIWQTNINDGLIINPTFTTAPVISENGNLYDAQLFGLYCVKSSGELNWKVNGENGGGTEYGNLHTPVLTHQGNIISVSSEQKVIRCFKGDGQGLSNSGWPKVYADYGNTSSH